jgi:hypothetical protein
MDKAEILECVKNYLEGALTVELDSDYGRAYLQGLRSLQGYIRQLEGLPEKPKKAA